jgi:hypothetical protein
VKCIGSGIRKNVRLVTKKMGENVSLDKESGEYLWIWKKQQFLLERFLHNWLTDIYTIIIFGAWSGSDMSKEELDVVKRKLNLYCNLYGYDDPLLSWEAGSYISTFCVKCKNYNDGLVFCRKKDEDVVLWVVDKFGTIIEGKGDYFTGWKKNARCVEWIRYV